MTDLLQYWPWDCPVNPRAACSLPELRAILHHDNRAFLLVYDPGALQAHLSPGLKPEREKPRWTR